MGAVNWPFEREKAGKCVRYVPGVQKILNNIKLNRTVSLDPQKIFSRIKMLFEHCHFSQPNQLHVTTKGYKVFLKGGVESFSEYALARESAWSFSGVIAVDSTHLQITKNTHKEYLQLEQHYPF